MRRLLMLAAAFLIVGAAVMLGFSLMSRSGGAGAVKSSHQSRLDRVPAQSLFVTTLDVQLFLDELIDHNLRLFPVHGDPAKLRADLREAGKQYLGIDPLAARRATIFVIPRGVAVRLEGDFGGPLLGEKKQVAGIDVVRWESGVRAALIQGDLVLGNRQAVEAAAMLAGGQEKSIAATPTALAAHTKALDAVGDGTLVASASFDADQLHLPAELRGINGGAFALHEDAGFTAAITGDGPALDHLESRLKGLETMAQTGVAMLLGRAASEKDGERVLALTLAKYELDELIAAVKIERRGETLVVSAPGPGGILAAYGAVLGLVFLRTNEVVMALERREGVREVVAHYADEVCACKDRACANRVMERFSAEAKRFQNEKGDQEETKAVEAEAKRIADCMTKLIE